MYSLLPAFVSAIFFGYGVYVVCARGWTRVTLSFFAVCLTSFFWQGIWAVLFQVQDAANAMPLVRLGYLFIIFLPTSLYSFLCEISGRTEERPLVYLSYALCAVLAASALWTDLFVDGYYEYFFGFYPKAGLLHPVHVLQTVVVVNRGLWLVYRQQCHASADKRVRLRLCVGAVLTYFLAAVDYACNYGFEFYPPGVLFIAIALGILTIAIVRYGLMNPMALAASVAHELRTPLAAIRMQARGVERYLPTLVHGYRLAVQNGLVEDSIDARAMQHLSGSGDSIGKEVERTSLVLDMLLASARNERFDRGTFDNHSVNALVAAAIERYSYKDRERERVHFHVADDFRFFGSDTLFTLVLFNLIKNSLYALDAAGKGTIEIATQRTPVGNLLHFTDTGTGIGKEALPHVFDAFFTTKQSGGSGLGLAFCQRVMTAFGGTIRCVSEPGLFTTFTLRFPVLEEDRMGSQPAARGLRTGEGAGALLSGNR